MLFNFSTHRAEYTSVLNIFSGSKSIVYIWYSQIMFANIVIFFVVCIKMFKVRYVDFIVQSFPYKFSSFETT